MFEIQIGKSIISVENESELQAFVDAGKATADTKIRVLGSEEWERLQNVDGIRLLKRCPVCAEWIQPEARLCRFCKSDLSRQISEKSDETYAYAIIAAMILELSLMWMWFPTLRLLDNPTGKLALLAIASWCVYGFLVYKDASILGIQGKPKNGTPAGWGLYAFLIPVIAIPHWLLYRWKFGGQRWVFYLGFILLVATIFSFLFSVAAVVEVQYGFQLKLDAPRYL